MPYREERHVQGIHRLAARRAGGGTTVPVLVTPEGALGIRPGVEVEDEAVVWREFDFVAGLLADGRPYLCGERFGAADLTFASLSAPCVVPPVYGVPLPQPEQLPAHTAALVRRAREHLAGSFALRIIDEQ